MPASSDGRAQAVADTPRSLTCRFPPCQVSGKRTINDMIIGALRPDAAPPSNLS